MAQTPKPTPPVAKPAPQSASAINKLKNMLIAGVAGTTSILIMYPVETLKTRLQLKSEARVANLSPIGTLKEIIKGEGVKSLYMGLPAALARQLLFASFRIGLFFNISDYLKQKKNKKTLSLLESTPASLFAGAAAISTVMPFDVVFVRMQAENSLPPAQRRGYTGLFNAIGRIAKEEGVGALWKGWMPAVARAMALNFGMLVPYELCKGLLAPSLGYTYTNYIISSAIAGFGASVCCLPFDNAKVRLQKMVPGPDGKLPYKGLIDCMGQCLRKEGIKGYWAGFWTFYSFLFPQTVIILLLNDFMRLKFGVSKI
jgi:solute carrier family 25 (mitochondrial oxoglutarate transporter), member 11